MRLSLSCFGLLLANPNQEEVFNCIKNTKIDGVILWICCGGKTKIPAAGNWRRG